MGDVLQPDRIPVVPTLLFNRLANFIMTMPLHGSDPLCVAREAVSSWFFHPTVRCDSRGSSSTAEQGTHQTDPSHPTDFG